MPRGHTYGNITLGKMITALESCDPDAEVSIGSLLLMPTQFTSYRGFYEDLALGYTTDRGEGLSAGRLLEECRKALGATFEGYKGGSYVMSKDTPIWLANYGDYTGWGVRKVKADGYRVRIRIKRIDT